VVHVNFYVTVITVSENKRGHITFVPTFVR